MLRCGFILLTPIDGVSEFAFRDRGLYLPSTETLVVADLHLGREAVSNVDAPLGAESDMQTRLRALTNQFEPTQLVLAGDILHSFSTLPAGVDSAVNALAEIESEVVAIAGNHDNRLEEVWPERVDAELKLADGTVICHGHQEPEHRGKRYIIGHDHPAISIAGKRYPCLCVDPTGYRGNELIVLPAFTRLAGGVELNNLRATALQSPLISSVESLQPRIWDADSETTLAFPPLGAFREML